MHFPSKLLKGQLVRRYKRFLVDIHLENGGHVTAHCPNTGSMQGVLAPGNSVFLSQSKTAGRKLPHTWELVSIDGTYVGVNTHNPNKIVQGALITGIIPKLSHYTTIKPEVKYGIENSRIDFLLTDAEGKQCYVEVKNAHYAKIESEQRVGIFPDSETSRGVKHLHELMRVIDQGHRAIVIYCLQRNDCDAFRFGKEFDPLYAETALKALKHGVEMLPYSCLVTPDTITLNKPLNIILET